MIDEQMNVLNLASPAFYGGANSGFSFTLAGVTRTDNAAWYYARDRRQRRTRHEEVAAPRRLRDAEHLHDNSPAATSAGPTSPACPNSHP